MKKGIVQSTGETKRHYKRNANQQWKLEKGLRKRIKEIFDNKEIIYPNHAQVKVIKNWLF